MNNKIQPIALVSKSPNEPKSPTNEQEPENDVEETLIRVRGDGNCFFRCLSYAFYNT